MATLIQASEIINGGLLRPAPMDVRFDALLLSPHIEFAEQRHLERLISSSLYEAMKEEKGLVQSNYNINYGALQNAFLLTPLYETFWAEHLLEFCALAVLYEALPYITQQISSQGLMINDTEFSRNSGVQGTKFMRDTLLQRIDFKAEKIKSFLCEKKEEFPSGVLTVNYCDDCQAKDSSMSKTLGIIFH